MEFEAQMKAIAKAVISDPASAARERYDFIIIGAGPAGCMLASRLDSTKAKPRILLVEAGGKNDSASDRIDAHRWKHLRLTGHNWGYKTVPQQHLDGRLISYDRGKGLGGSTAINFSQWTVAPRDEHDEIARVVDDDEWRWENAHARYKKIETFHGYRSNIPDGYKQYANPDPRDRGSTGPIHIGFPKIWDRNFGKAMDMVLDSGVRLNPDPNNGDPVGVGIAAQSAYDGVRSSSADALKNVSENLSILVDAQVARIMIENGAATGIELTDGTKILAKNEVIVSCGSLDSPRILMHSGIGPSKQLSEFNIPPQQINEHVGQHLKDHQHIILTWETDDKTNPRHQFYRSKEIQDAARVQWDKDHTGPLAEIDCLMGFNFAKSKTVEDSNEFRNLPKEMKSRLTMPTVPLYYLAVNTPSFGYFMDPDNAPPSVSMFIVLMNLQSEGEAYLQSSDPTVPLAFDPKLFSHPFDRRAAVQATREVFQITDTDSFRQSIIGLAEGPKSNSEDDILAYWRRTTGSTAHMCGTCRMGRDIEHAVVDKNFKVFGVKGLRVADMSVAPILASANSSAMAYLIGLMAGDKLAREYELD